MIIKRKFGTYRVRQVSGNVLHSAGLYRLTEENRTSWYGGVQAVAEEIERREKVKQEAAEWKQFESLARIFIERSRR